MLVWVGRFLLTLCAVSLSTMPLTQRLWTWDRFLHGGHDFESVVLLFLIFISLVLVLSKQCRQCVGLLFAQSVLPGCKLAPRRSAGIAPRGWAFQINPLPSPALSMCSIPLQI